MVTVAHPSFFLLCWLLRTASSAFPEEPGPLNFIPTEGIDLLTFSPSSRLLPCVPLSEVVMCEVWGRALTGRVLNRGRAWRRPRVMVWALAVKHMNLSREGCWLVSRPGGVGLRWGMRTEWRTLAFMTFSHTQSDPQETQLLTHSDFESPYQLGSL